MHRFTCPIFTDRRCVLCVFVGVLGLVGSGHASDSPRSTTLSTAWHSISLPFRPVCIASDGNVLWVGGVDEMLARSQDGGETWRAWKAGPERVIDVVFTDASHGLRRTLSGVEITEDGGTHWSDVSVMKTDEGVRPFSNILGIAAVDAAHFALLLKMTQGENIFLSTQDGDDVENPAHGQYLRTAVVCPQWTILGVRNGDCRKAEPRRVQRSAGPIFLRRTSVDPWYKSTDRI